MTVKIPIWWRYVILKDVDGVGIVEGFIEGTPQEVIDQYHRDMKMWAEAEKNGYVL